jgi:pimeloyl-ACP methyl ester carboxylesterase
MISFRVSSYANPSFRIKTSSYITIPSLFIAATNDVVLKPEMADRMGRNFSNLTKSSVEAGHWALWEKPDDVNAILKDWLEKQVFGSKSTL